MRLAAFTSRNRSLTGPRGLGAFDPRTRSLSAFDPRTRSLNGLACDCRNQNMARLGRLRGMGDDFTPAENYFLDTGVNLTPPVSTTYDPYSNQMDNNSLIVNTDASMLLTPQQIAAKQLWGTTNPTASQNNVLMAAQTAGYNLANMTAAQIANIRKAAPGGSWIPGLANQSLLLYGAIGIVAVALLGHK